MKTRRLLALFSVLLAAAAVTHVVGQDSTRGNSSRFVDSLTNRPVLVRSWTRVQDAVSGAPQETEKQDEKETTISHTAQRRWQFPLLERDASAPSSRFDEQPVTATLTPLEGQSQSTSPTSEAALPLRGQVATPPAAPSDQNLNTNVLSGARLAMPATQFDVSPATVKPEQRWTPQAATDAPQPTSVSLSDQGDGSRFAPGSSTPTPSASQGIAIREPKTAVVAPPVATQVTPPPSTATPVFAPRVSRDAIKPVGNPAVVRLYCQGPEQVNLGEEVTFVLTLDHQGGAPVKGIEIFATIPPTLKLLSAESKIGELFQPSNISSGQLVWKLNQVASNSRNQAEIKLLARQGGPVELPVEWTQVPISNSASIDVVDPRLQLAVTGPQESWQDEAMTLQVTATNTGTGATDDLTLQTTVGGEVVGTSQIGALTQGQSKSVSINIAPTTSGNLLFNVAAADKFGTTANAQHSVLVGVREADLTLVASGPQQVYLGEPTTLRLSLANNGTGSADAITVNAQIADSTAATTQVEKIAVGESKQFDLPITASEAGLHLVNLTATDRNGQSATTQHRLNVEARTPQLTLDVTGKSQLLLGESCTLNVKLSNVGNGDAKDVTVEVAMGQEPKRGSDLGTIRAGETKELAIDVTPKVAGDNVVLVTVGNDVDAQASASHTVTATPRVPALAIAITGPAQLRAGQSSVLQLAIKNSGNGTADNVKLSVQLDNDAAKTLDLGTIAAGGEKQLEIDVAPTNVGVTRVVATVTSEGISADAVHQIEVSSAQIAVVPNGPQQRFAGSVGNYSFTVKNSGNAAAHNLKVAALLPTGAKVISSSQATALGRELQWTVGTLNAGESRTYGVSIQLAQPGSHALKFITQANDAKTARAEYHINVRTVANLQLTVQEPQGPLPVGQVVTYAITVKNDGSVAAQNVQVIARMDSGLQIVSAGGGSQSGGQVTFPAIATLSPGEVKKYQLSAKPTLEGSQKYRVEVNSTNPPSQRASEGSTYFYNAQ